MYNVSLWIGAIAESLATSFWSIRKAFLEEEKVLALNCAIPETAISQARLGSLIYSKDEASEADLKMSNLMKEIETLTSQKSKFDKQSENLQNKLNQLQEERKKFQEQIDKKESEQEENSSELQSVLGTLQSLMESIDRSAGDVKSDIQNASQVAIDESESVLRSFVMDITDTSRFENQSYWRFYLF